MPTRGEVPQAYLKYVKHHVKPMVYLGVAVGLMLPLTVVMCFAVFVHRRFCRRENSYVQ